MFRIGSCSRLVCLLGIGMVACATAAEAPGPKGSGGSVHPGLELDVDAATDVDGDTDEGVEHDPVPDGDRGPGMSQPGSDEGMSGCDCGSSQLPGITIRADGSEISLKLPNIGVVIVKANGGSCQDTGNGLHITGNVAIDLGSGTDVLLLNADLDVTGSVDGGFPDISGTANLSGDALATVLQGVSIEGALPVTVSLDTDVEVPGSATGVALDLALKLPCLTLPSGDLPALNDGVAIIDADVVLATDGRHDLVAVWGTVDAAANILASMAPIALSGDLKVRAMIANDELLNLTLNGDIGLVGNSLNCGLRPVASIEIPDATLVLDDDGLTLDGRTTAAAALNPALSAEADADIKARVTKEEFYIRICASALADVDLLGITVHADADATVCLALTPLGPTTCSCARGGDQPDDDSDQPDEGDDHGSGAF